jgi:hypothetical protein
MLFKNSIIEKKFKLADFLLIFVKEKCSKNVFTKIEANFGDFSKMILDKMNSINNEYERFFANFFSDQQTKDKIGQNFNEYIQHMLENT